MPTKGPVIDIGLRIQDVSKVVGDLENKVSKVKTLGLDKAARNDIENIEKMLADFQKQIDNLGHSKVNTTTFSKSQQAVIDKVNELESRTSALEVGMKTLIDTMAKADGGKFATQMKDLADTMTALSSATSNAITAISAIADAPEVTEETLQLKEMAVAINEVKQAFDKEPKVKKFKTEEDAVKSILKEYDKYMDTMDKLIDLKDSGIDSKDKEKQLLTLQKSLYETGDKIDAMMAKAVDSFGDSFYKNKDSYGASFQSMSDAIMREMDDIEADIEKKVKEIQRKLPDAFEEINKEPVNVTVNPVVPKKAGKSIQKQVDAVADDTTVTVSNVEVEPEAAKEAVEAVSDAVQDSTSDIKDTLQEVVQDATEAANAVSEIVDEKEISDEVSQLKEMAMAIKDVQDTIYKKQKADKFESDEEAFEAVIEEYSKYQDIMDEIYELQEKGIDTKEQEKQLLSLQKTAVETGNKIDVMMDEAAQAFGPDFYSHKDSFGASFEKISEDVILQDLYEIQNEIEAKAEQIAKDLSAALPDDMLESFGDGIESASSGMGSVLDSTLKSLGVQAADSVEPEMKNVGAELAQSVSEGILSQEETIKNSLVKVFHGVKGAQDNAHFTGSTSGPKQFFTDNKGLALNYAGSYGSADTAFLDTSKFFNLPGYGNEWKELVYLGDGLSEESKTAIELYKKLIDDLHALENITDDKLGFDKKNGFITAFIDNLTGEVVAELDNSTNSFYRSIKSKKFVSNLEKGFDDLSGETKVIFDKFIDDLKAYQDHLYDLNGKLFSGKEIGNSISTDDYALKLNKTKEYTGLYASNIYDPPSGHGKHDLNSEWIMFEKDANEVVKAAWAIKGATETYNNFEKAFNDILGKITSTKMGKINKEIVEKSKLLNDLNKDKNANSTTFDQDQLMEDTATELEDLVTQKMVLQNKIDNITDYIQQLNSQAKAQGYKKGLNDILKNMDDIEDLPDEMKQLFALSGLVDKVGNSTLNKVSGGHTNKGVYQNDEFTIIERGLEYNDKIEQLIPKLHKAAQEGISVGEIYGKVVDSENDIIYEIQSTVQGKNIAKSNDYLKATDDQIQKLYDDIEKLNKIGLFIDVGGDNINYDEKTGFSFYDMMSHITEKNKAYTASTAKETIDRYFKNQNEEFYNRIYKTVDQLNPNKQKDPGKVVYDKAKAKELYKEYKALKDEYESIPSDADDDTFNSSAEKLAKKVKEIKDVYSEIKEIYEDWESLYNDGLASWDDVDKASDNLAAYEHLMHKIGESTDDFTSATKEADGATEDLSDEVKQAISNYNKFKDAVAKTETAVMTGNAMDEELEHAEANFKYAEKALAKLGYVFDETSGKIIQDIDKANASLSEIDKIDDVSVLIEKFYELQKAQKDAGNNGNTADSKQYLSTLNEIGNKLEDLGYEYNGLSNVWEEAPKFFEEPELSEDNAIELFKKYKELKDEYNSLPKDAGVDKLKEASDKCMAVEADMKAAYEAAKKNFDDMSDLYSTGAIPLSVLENAEKTLFAYEVDLKKIGINIGSIGDISEEAGESVSDFAQSVKEASYEDDNIENLLEAWEHYYSISKKQIGKYDGPDFDNVAVEKTLELGEALESLGYKYDKAQKKWQEPIETKEALDQAEKLIDSKTTDADALIETYQKLSDIQKNMHPNETVFDYVTIADSVLVAIDNVAVSLDNLGYTWDDLNKQWTKSADTVEDVSENLGKGFVSMDSLMEKAVNAMDEAIEEGSKLADKLEEIADESEFMSIKEYYSVDNLLKGDNSAENINKVIDELWATYDKLEYSGMIEASDEGRYIDEAVDKLKAYAKELGYFNDTLWNRFVDISPEKLLNGDYTLDNFKKIWSEMTDTYANAPENITEVMDAQFRALIEKGKELGFTLQDIGGHLNFAPAITESVEESTEKISEEAQDFIEVSEKAEQAAMSKEEFAAANAEVLKSIIESLNGLENEGEAFANLNKLLNNLGGTKGSEKLEKTKEGIAAIIELLSRPVDDSAFITALQKIAESGSNLGDIAAILKASKKDLLEAKKVFDEINTEDIDNLMKYHAQDIMKNAKKELMALGGNGTQIINISELNKTKDGLIEVVGLIRTADDTLQEFTLHTKDGIHMQNVGMTENTAKIAKQMKVYAQVQQFFDKMQAQGKSVTDGAFFDKNADPDIWQMLIDYAKDYHEELGNILSITTQVRQASNGDLLQSFSINGENGHLTVGPEGETVASNQQLLNVEELEKRIKALSQTTKKYHTLLMEQGTEGWTDAHAQELKKIEDEYADIVRLVKEYSDILGDSTDITEVFEAAVNKMTVDFNNTEQTYIDKVKKSLDDALNNPNNKNQEFTESFNEELRLAIQNVNELQELINSHGESKAPWSEDEITKIKELHSNIDGTVLSIKDLENILAKSVSVDKLLTKINNDLKDNSAMPKELKARYIELRNEIDKARKSLDGLNKVDYSRLEAQFQSLHQEMVRVGKTGKSMVEQISQAIRSQSVQFIAKYFSLQDVIRYTRTLAQNVINIDSAITELRKVSDASNERLQQSFEKSSESAQELGQTIQHIINVTADWSRLNKLGLFVW